MSIVSKWFGLNFSIVRFEPSWDGCVRNSIRMQNGTDELKFDFLFRFSFAYTYLPFTSYQTSATLLLFHIRVQQHRLRVNSNNKIIDKFNCYLEIRACIKRVPYVTAKITYYSHCFILKISIAYIRAYFFPWNSNWFFAFNISERFPKPATLHSVQFAMALNWRMASTWQDIRLHQSIIIIRLWPMTLRCQNEDKAQAYIHNWTKRTT